MQSGRSSTSSAAVSPSATAPIAELGSSVATIVKLGVGALGLAWSLTTTAAYLPPVLGEYTGVDLADRRCARRRRRSSP